VVCRHRPDDAADWPPVWPGSGGRDAVCRCWICGWSGPSTSTSAFRLTGGPRVMAADRGRVEPIALDPCRPRPVARAGAGAGAGPPASLCALWRRTGGSEPDRHPVPRRNHHPLGVIVRHRPLGYTANAMVVWDLPEDRIDAAGLALAALPGVTLCYRRRTVPGVWPYALYSMIHGTSRPLHWPCCTPPPPCPNWPASPQGRCFPPAASNRPEPAFRRPHETLTPARRHP
jgi:hypothetical protein